MGSPQIIPNWLRSYELRVYSPQLPPEGALITSSAWEPRALRITFDVLQSVLPSPYWYADIDVYNFNGPSAQNMLTATRVTLSAGYQSLANNPSTRNSYGIIWDGPVMQMLFDRQNVVDNKFTFHCIASIPLLNDAFVQARNGIMKTQYDVLQNMIGLVNAQSSGGATTIVGLSSFTEETLKAKTYPRGKGFFGVLPDYLETLADDNFLAHYQDYVKANLTELMASPSGKLPPVAIAYGPPLPPGYVGAAGSGGNISRTIIGSPRQTPTGVIMSVLLDPRLKVNNPPLLVHIDNSVITQATVNPPNYIAPLPASMNFFANQIRHRGDSRGNSWYTEVNGFTPQYAQGFLAAILGGQG